MIAETIARLKELDSFKLVEGVASFQAASMNNPVATPAAYVFRLTERPGQNRIAGGGVLQLVTAEVGVVIVIQHSAGAKGGDASDAMQPFREAVKAKLFGWAPAEGHDPYERGPSDLLLFRDNFMWWKDNFLTRFNDRSY